MIISACEFTTLMSVRQNSLLSYFELPAYRTNSVVNVGCLAGSLHIELVRIIFDVNAAG